MKALLKGAIIKRIIHWLLAIVSALYLVTGFGITEFRTVEALTFGLLTKPLSFVIHENLFIPFIVLLSLHIFILPLIGFCLKSRRRKLVV